MNHETDQCKRSNRIANASWRTRSQNMEINAEFSTIGDDNDGAPISTISLRLPDELDAESRRVAKSLGVSHETLILRALTNELARHRREREIEEMKRAMRAMAADPEYLREAEELDEGLYDPIDDEDDAEWWNTPP